MFQIRILFIGMEIMWNLLKYGSQIQVGIHFYGVLMYVRAIINFGCVSSCVRSEKWYLLLSYLWV